MALLADPELTKAFQELQIQILNTREKVRHIEAEIALCERQSTVYEITKKTITELKPEMNCFIGVGRAFAQKDQKEILNIINLNIKNNKEKISKLKQAKEYQEGKVKETENNIREMIQQKKNADKK